MDGWNGRNLSITPQQRCSSKRSGGKWVHPPAPPSLRLSTPMSFLFIIATLVHPIERLLISCPVFFLSLPALSSHWDSHDLQFVSQFTRQLVPLFAINEDRPIYYNACEASQPVNKLVLYCL